MISVLALYCVCNTHTLMDIVAYYVRCLSVDGIVWMSNKSAINCDFHSLHVYKTNEWWCQNKDVRSSCVLVHDS